LAFFFLAFALLGAFFADFFSDFLAFLPTLVFGPTFLATFFAARRTFLLRRFRWYF